MHATVPLGGSLLSTRLVSFSPGSETWFPAGFVEVGCVPRSCLAKAMLATMQQSELTACAVSSCLALLETLTVHLRGRRKQDRPRGRDSCQGRQDDHRVQGKTGQQGRVKGKQRNSSWRMPAHLFADLKASHTCRTTQLSRWRVPPATLSSSAPLS